MAFNPVAVRTPTGIGTITLILGDPDGDNNSRSINGTVEVLDDNADIMRVWEGDLQPHLSAGQLSALVAFLNQLRNQAETELLA